MIIFAALFLGLFSILSPFFTAVFAASEAVTSYCALVTFGAIAVAIFMRSRMAWVVAFLGIIVAVGIELLAPSASMFIIITCGMFSLIATIAVKRPILLWLRADARRPAAQGGPLIPQWARGILTII